MLLAHTQKSACATKDKVCQRVYEVISRMIFLGTDEIWIPSFTHFVLHAISRIYLAVTDLKCIEIENCYVVSRTQTALVHNAIEAIRAKALGKHLRWRVVGYTVVIWVNRLRKCVPDFAP